MGSTPHESPREFYFFAFHTKFIILTVPICVFIKLDSMNHKNSNDGPHRKLSEFEGSVTKISRSFCTVGEVEEDLEILEPARALDVLAESAAAFDFFFYIDT